MDETGILTLPLTKDFYFLINYAKGLVLFLLLNLNMNRTYNFPETRRLFEAVTSEKRGRLFHIVTRPKPFDFKEFLL